MEATEWLCILLVGGKIGQELHLSLSVQISIYHSRPREWYVELFRQAGLPPMPNKN